MHWSFETLIGGCLFRLEPGSKLTDGSFAGVDGSPYHVLVRRRIKVKIDFDFESF